MRTVIAFAIFNEKAQNCNDVVVKAK